MLNPQENQNENIRHDEILIPMEDAQKRHRAVANWIIQDNSLLREFKFKDFNQAIIFVNNIAKLAEEENHHPDIFISYNKVKLTLTTHKSGGLTTKDFALAYKIDHLNGNH